MLHNKALATPDTQFTVTAGQMGFSVVPMEQRGNNEQHLMLLLYSVHLIQLPDMLEIINVIRS